MDVWCIPESGCCCLFVPLFFLSPIFKYTLFSGTVRLRRLKLGTHVDSGQMYRVYQNQAGAAAYLFLNFFIFLFSNFQTLQFFVTPFSGAVRPRRLKRYTHMDNGSMNRVYRKFS